jgi:hypothetical protein
MTGVLQGFDQSQLIFGGNARTDGCADGCARELLTGQPGHLRAGQDGTAIADAYFSRNAFAP